ncbi:MAG: hypothetical protein ABI429_00570 [Jatrophihabitantaceae bacterium]
MGTHLNDTAGNCRILSLACSDLADHIDTAHSAIEGEVKSFIEWSAGIEAVGAAPSFFSFGIAEAPTQAAEAGRIAATGAKIAELCRTLISAANAVADTVVDVFGRIAETAGKLKLILGAKLSEVATTLAARFGSIAKGAEATAEADPASASRVGSLDFSTMKDQAFFWSGRTDGVGGATVPADRAGAGGGKTLEQIMEERGIKMPEWNPDDPSSICGVEPGVGAVRAGRQRYRSCGDRRQCAAGQHLANRRTTSPREQPRGHQDNPDRSQDGAREGDLDTMMERKMPPPDATNAAELSRAVVVYVGRGYHASPHPSRDRVVETFGDLGPQLAAAAASIVDEADATTVDWSDQTLQQVGKYVRGAIASRHPELTDEALDAIYWKWTYDWR